MRTSVLPTSKGNSTRDKDQTIERLMMDLSSDDDSARRNARQSLVAIGNPAVRRLLEALRQKDDPVRWE
jgi:HEAT repeat protein